MFGYVVPDKPHMMIKDYALYRSVYCGICKSIKKTFGNIPRITTNYDSVFLSILLHNYLNRDYVLKKERCVLHPLKSRFMAQDDELTQKIVAANIILAYHKFTDDIIDGGRLFKRLARQIVVRRAYKKACKLLPNANEIVSQKYAELRQCEKTGEKSIDRVADSFASMLSELGDVILGEDSSAEINSILYNVGKWIYIIDAVDDLQKDKESGNYNPILSACGNFSDIDAYKAEISEKLNFTFNCIFDRLEQEFLRIEFSFNTDVLQNILLKGIKTRTKTIMECNNRCRKIRI